MEQFVKHVHLKLAEAASAGQADGSLTERQQMPASARIKADDSLADTAKIKSSQVYGAVRHKLPIYERNKAWEKCR